MGLLDRARETLPDVQEEWNIFLESLETLNRGVDFSIVLYRKLISYFDIDKSALFFRTENDDQGFNCLSAIGYDKTTVNRLRLDERALDSELFHVLNSEKRAALSSSQDLSFFNNYFSSREFGLMDDLYWLAFIHEEKVFSLILFSQWKAFPPEDWELLFSEVSKRFSESVYISRKPLAAQKTVSVQRFSDKVLKSFIDERSTRNVHLFSIDLSRLIDQLQSSGSGMNRLNMKKEIISVFRTMSGPNQGLLDLDNQKVLFMLDKERIPDRGLFIHQLSSSLPLLFQDLTESPALQTEDFTIPENDDDWQTLTETLLR